MKFTTAVKSLKSAIDTVGKCIQAKPLMPILAGIKLEFYAGELIVTGYNLAEGLQVVCECEDGEDGSIVILKDDLSTLLNKVFGTIEVEVIDKTVKIITGSSSIELSGLNSSEYPELIFHLDMLAEDSNSASVELPVKSLTEAIEKCAISASNAEDKQLLQGINIKSVDGNVVLAATDGHRLTVCTILCDGNIPSSTIPAKFLTKLPKTIAEQIHLSLSDGQALLTDESSNSSICRLYDGTYPSYEMLLPKTFSRNLAVNRSELIDLLSVAEFAASNSNSVELKIKGKELAIHSKRESATAISTMECELTGNIINIGFNLKYLLQGLKMFDDDMITLNLNGSLDPVTIVSLDGLTTHLIMPIQIIK
jgi:DNA polymerase III subunit beta